MEVGRRGEARIPWAVAVSGSSHWPAQRSLVKRSSWEPVYLGIWLVREVRHCEKCCLSWNLKEEASPGGARKEEHPSEGTPQGWSVGQWWTGQRNRVWRVKTLGTHVLVGTSPRWPWRVAGFSLEPSAAGGDEWGLWDSWRCKRVLGQHCASHKGEGPRKGWQARWAGERCVVIDSRCVSVCVKSECVWLQYYLLGLGVQVKQVCPRLDNHWWWLMGTCMSIILFSLLCVCLKFLTMFFFFPKLLP